VTVLGRHHKGAPKVSVRGVNTTAAVAPSAPKMLCRHWCRRNGGILDRRESPTVDRVKPLRERGVWIAAGCGRAGCSSAVRPCPGWGVCGMSCRGRAAAPMPLRVHRRHLEPQQLPEAIGLRREDSRSRLAWCDGSARVAIVGLGDADQTGPHQFSVASRGSAGQGLSDCVCIRLDSQTSCGPVDLMKSITDSSTLPFLVRRFGGVKKVNSRLVNAPSR